MRLRFGALLALTGVMSLTAQVRAQDEDSNKDEGTKDEERRTDNKKKPNPSPYADARADDWFSLSSPAVDVDGYFRTRAELFHNLSLSRLDAKPLWPQPVDNSFTDTANQPHLVRLCADPLQPEVCNNEVQAGANLRFRIEPSFHISDNLHVWSQIDFLDNVVLGSTPQGYANAPSDPGGYHVVARGGYSPIGAFAATQWTHISNVNSVDDAVMVKRIWGSYVSPIGKIAFGRMPHDWGLGMLRNAGDGYDSDWQSTVDRLQFTYEFTDWNLYVSGAWDFANEGVTSSNQHGEQRLPNATVVGAGTFQQDGQPYDQSTKDDLDRWEFSIVHKLDPQVIGYELAKGRPVINAGTLIAYTTQDLAHESIDAGSSTPCPSGAPGCNMFTPGEGASIGSVPSSITRGFVRRGYEAVITDVWLQLLYDKLRFEIEAAWHFGSLENTQRADNSDFSNLLDPSNDGWTINQFGITTQTQWRALEDRLRLEFGFGFASGDGDVASLSPVNAPDGSSSLQQQLTLDRTYSTFAFHPDYRIDLILFRNILTRVQGAYYFKPGIEYDFLRDPSGQRAGGGASVIWSRASEPIQTPGHAPDLGLELNFKLFYQISDGRMSTDVQEMGGFYTAVEYGVLFPLDGLHYLPGEVDNYAAANPSAQGLDVDPAQLARWYLGIMF